MNTEITTLGQAAAHINSQGIVQFGEEGNIIVEGKDLLEVCGYSITRHRATLSDLIEKHKFEEGVDFMRTEDRTHKKRGQKPVVYEFTMNAANHVLLTAMTEKGKAAREKAIKTEILIQDNGGQRALMDFIEEQRIKTDAAYMKNQDFMLDMKVGYEARIEAKQVIIISKSEPMSLTKLIGPSNKVVQAANLWLEEEGYQERNFVRNVRHGWKLSDKGRELGTQISNVSIYWTDDIKALLPPISELLRFAERMNLTDYRGA